MITKFNFRPLRSVITEDSITIQDAALSVADIVKGAQSGMIDLDSIRLPASDVSDDVDTVDDDLPVIDDIAVASEYVDTVNSTQNTYNSTSHDNATDVTHVTDDTSDVTNRATDVTNRALAQDESNVDVTQ